MFKGLKTKISFYFKTGEWGGEKTYMAKATSKGENDMKYNSSGKQGARSLRELKVERRLGFSFECNGKEIKGSKQSYDTVSPFSPILSPSKTLWWLSGIMTMRRQK